MNQKDLQRHIDYISESLATKRSGIISTFRKKLEEKGIAYVKDSLNKK